LSCGFYDRHAGAGMLLMLGCGALAEGRCTIDESIRESPGRTVNPQTTLGCVGICPCGWMISGTAGVGSDCAFWSPSRWAVNRLAYGLPRSMRRAASTDPAGDTRTTRTMTISVRI